MREHRFLPVTEGDRAEMLAAVGARSIDDLFSEIPAPVRLGRALAIPPALSEQELADHLTALAARNADPARTVSFLGAGAYDHYVPAAVGHVMLRSEFYTAYTPYQPEVSQGTLQAIFEYQSLVCLLTGMDVSNASLYEGATAMTEGALMACSITGRRRVVVSEAVHPQYRGVLKTYLGGKGWELVTVPASAGVTDPAALSSAVDGGTACVILQHPNFFGSLEDLSAAERLAHANGALLNVSTLPVALGVLKPPGEYGADIVTAEGAHIGNAVLYGGPYLGVLAAREKHVRHMPGRICGQTVDREGRRAFVLTLQTREQHIRREKANSNICTNQGLMALCFAVHLSLLGPAGLRELASMCIRKAHYLADRLSAAGIRRSTAAPFAYEFPVKLRISARDAIAKLLPKGLVAGADLGRWYPERADELLIAVTERVSRADLDRFVDELARVGAPAGAIR